MCLNSPTKQVPHVSIATWGTPSPNHGRSDFNLPGCDRPPVRSFGNLHFIEAPANVPCVCSGLSRTSKTPFAASTITISLSNAALNRRCRVHDNGNADIFI